MVICYRWGRQVAFLLKSALNRLNLSGGRLQGEGFFWRGLIIAQL